jgi:hypothetical protein
MGRVLTKCRYDSVVHWDELDEFAVITAASEPLKATPVHQLGSYYSGLKNRSKFCRLHPQGGRMPAKRPGIGNNVLSLADTESVKPSLRADQPRFRAHPI